MQVGERLQFEVTDTLLTVRTDDSGGGRITRYPLDGSEGVTGAPVPA